MLSLAPGNPPTDAKDTNISSISLCSYPSFVATTFSSGNHFGFKSKEGDLIISFNIRGDVKAVKLSELILSNRNWLMSNLNKFTVTCSLIQEINMGIKMKSEEILAEVCKDMLQILCRHYDYSLYKEIRA